MVENGSSPSWSSRGELRSESEFDAKEKEMTLEGKSHPTAELELGVNQQELDLEVFWILGDLLNSDRNVP
jgi:hypothetical protein